MGMVDEATGEYNNNAFALDTISAVNKDKSIFESAGDVITKGIPLTGISIINSFANTAVDIGNFFGGDYQRLSVQDYVGEGEYNDYYKEHAQGIEAAGLIAGSFIPGTIAIKALKLAQLGKMGGAMSRATNIFAGPKQRIIDNALAEINAGDAALYASLNADKFKAIALGFGDQALQALSYEVATYATMKASPLLDKDSLGDVVSNVFFGALVGGGIGGVIEGIGTRALIEKAKVLADVGTKAQEHATYLGKGGYFAGDRVIALLDSLDQIPEATNLLGRKKASKTTDTAILNSKKILGTLVNKGDEEVTNSLFDVLYKMKNEGGMDKEEMFNYLARLDKVSRIGDNLEVSFPEKVSSSAIRINGKVYTGQTHGDAYNAALKDFGGVDPGSTAADRNLFVTNKGRVINQEEASQLGRGGPGIFYVNRFGTKDLRNGEVTWDQLVTNKAEEGAAFSLGFRLREFATKPVFARFDDAVEWEGKSAAKYRTQQEAFDAGADIYIDGKLRISVNPNAPNIERVARPGESRPLTPKEEIEYRKTGKLPEGSQPLRGAAVILSTTTGNISEHAIAVVGDYGTPKLFDKGVSFGEKTSTQSLASVVTKDTSTIDANARYVWASLRGLSKGDTIAPTDVALLEQLYREVLASPTIDFAKAIADIAKKKGVSIEGMEMPTTADGLLNLIRESKDNLIKDLLGDAKLSSTDVALRANVPDSYLENALKATDPKDYMVDPAEHMKVNHVQLEYNIGNIYQQDGQILRGMLDTQYRINLIKDTLKAAHANFFGPDFEQFLAKGTAADATINGVGPKAFSFSNASYGSLGQEMERIGKFVTQRITKRMGELSDSIASETNAIRNDPAAAAELGMFVAVRRRTTEKFTFLPEQLKAKYFPQNAPEDVAVLTDSLKRDKAGNVVDWDTNFTPQNFLNMQPKHLVDRAGEHTQEGLYTFYPLSKKVADFERASMAANNNRLVARNNWYASQGLNRTFPLDTLYAPPIDTAKYPHFAMVKLRAGTGMADDGVAVITAENAAQLEAKMAALRDEYSVFTKDDLKKHHEVIGDYDYNRNFAQSTIDTALRRKGILNNIFPDTRAESIVKDYIDWHSKQEMRLVRDYVELGNGQLFAELRAMGERFTAAETSKTGFVAGLLGRTTPNPYNDYIKTALGISEKENYRLWAEANEKVEAFFSTAFRAAKDSFTAAKSGLISYEEASKVAEKFGLGNPYSAATDAMKAYYETANRLPPERYLSKFVSTANSALATTVIRLDAFQSIINTISTPILLLAEANSVKSSPAMKALLTTELPDGSGRMIPATSKLLYNSVGNWFNADVKAQWMPVYKDIGAVRSKSADMAFEMIDNLTLPYGKFSESEALKKLDRGVEMAAKLTGSNLSEEFGRFIAADTARQLFEAAGYKGRELTDNISTFVNRVHGNYIASQRPIAFQGPIGQAIGLFQTYQFNLLQQLFRYVENGEGKTLAILAGMQTTLFGLQGLPGFQAVNNHIIGNASNNPAHKDVYSVLPNFFDKKLGDYLLYGVTSNWLNTGLYSRGDINPRQITVIPTNPLDYPAIAGGIRFVGNLMDTAGKIAQGGAVVPSILLGLEHNGLSRPLAGIAQLSQGFVTTSKGELVARTGNPLGDNTIAGNEIYNIATYSRLLGARPLDEAIAMDALYRSTLYKAKDTARIGELGQAVKTHLYAGSHPGEDVISDFATKYAAAGGRIDNFGRKMREWTQASNASTANKVFRSLSSPINQNMMQIMGGVPLPDYTNTGDMSTGQP